MSHKQDSGVGREYFDINYKDFQVQRDIEAAQDYEHKTNNAECGTCGYSIPENYHIAGFLAGIQYERNRQSEMIKALEIKLAAIRYLNTNNISIDQKLNSIQALLKAQGMKDAKECGCSASEQYTCMACKWKMKDAKGAE